MSAPSLHDYETGECLRDATEAEARESADAATRDGGAGVIRIDYEAIEEYPSSDYEDADDCLAAAVATAARAHGVESWACTARWTDDERETITVIVRLRGRRCYVRE